jgi:hypothetical protein
LRHRLAIRHECAARHRTIMIGGYADIVDASALMTADVPVLAMARRQRRCVA